MTYALLGTGAATTGFNVTLTPAIPVAAVAGCLLLLHTGSYQGSLGTPAVSGWTKLSPGVNANQVALYGRIATGSDAASVAWGNQFSFAFVTAYSSNLATLTGIVHASADKANLATNAVGYSALTITQANCLVIAGAAKDKTATTNGATYSTYGGFSVRNQVTLSGTSISAVMNDLIQTTATSLTAGNQFLTIAESANTQYESYVVALLSGTTPPLTKPSQLACMGVG